MTLVASNIRANTASLQDEIEELRRSAKHDLSDCANLRSVSANLRERIARLKDLERNSATEEANPSLARREKGGR